jgi:hypothetical protein
MGDSSQCERRSGPHQQRESRDRVTSAPKQGKDNAVVTPISIPISAVQLGSDEERLVLEPATLVSVNRKGQESPDGGA